MSDVLPKAQTDDIAEGGVCGSPSPALTPGDHREAPCEAVSLDSRAAGVEFNNEESAPENNGSSASNSSARAMMRYPALSAASSSSGGRIAGTVIVDPSVAQAQDRLNALLDNIDSKRKREEPSSAVVAPVESPFDWVRYKDPQTSMDYYYNIRTGVTQWERPAAFAEGGAASTVGSASTVSSRASTSGYMYGVGGDDYVAQASFNKKVGSFGVAGTTTYWEQMGRPNDRAGRQLAAFFDLNSFEQNRAEAALKKQKLQQSHVDWKQYKEEKKKKKDAQKKEWLLKDD